MAKEDPPKNFTQTAGESFNVLHRAFSKMEEQLWSTPVKWCFLTNVTSMMSNKAKI